jgi:hypothetical protein
MSYVQRARRDLPTVGEWAATHTSATSLAVEPVSEVEYMKRIDRNDPDRSREHPSEKRHKSHGMPELCHHNILGMYSSRSSGSLFEKCADLCRCWVFEAALPQTVIFCPYHQS